MTKIKFIEKDKNTYDVELNGANYGSLEFNSDQNVYVLWFWGCYGDEGVTYFEDLKETEECIADEIYFAEKEKTKEKAKQ